MKATTRSADPGIEFSPSPPPELSQKCWQEGTTELLPTEVVAAAAAGECHTAPKTAAGKNRVLGDYELLEEIARGGMGVVYKARQISLNRPVAVKLMLSGKFASEEFVRRFRGEAEAVASLQHPNIVAIHEVGEEAGQHYFSMDYVVGQSLADRTRDNPLPPDVAADYLKTIADAVHYAHIRGILHRDLKPSNVLIDDLDRPRVTDFGLAKRLRGDANLTSTGQVLGSPNYMPPEQADPGHGSVGPTSDVYSLGAIFYHLLTGRPPFLADGVEETLRQLLNAEPLAPRLLNPAVPRDLETICLKCLDKEPRRRYATAQALAEDLKRWLRREPILARPSTQWDWAVKWTRRRPAVAAMVAALTLSIGLGVPTVLWLWRAAVLARREATELARAEKQARERAEQAAVLIEIQRAEESFQRFDRPKGLAHLAQAARQFHTSKALAGSLFRALVANPQTLSAEFDPEDGHVVSAVSRETVVRVEEPLVPVPDWIPDLVEALAGERLDDLGNANEVPPEELAALKQRVLLSTSLDVWTRWAKSALTEAQVSTNTMISSDQAASRRGKALYAAYCLPCHGPDGRGLRNTWPPLAGSDWVLAPGPNRIIRIVLNGLQGPITVRGKKFDRLPAPGFRGVMNDEEIAAVVTYIRGNEQWGHAVAPVSPAQVTAIREATESRNTPWTAAELLAIPEND